MTYGHADLTARGASISVTAYRVIPCSFTKPGTMGGIFWSLSYSCLRHEGELGATNRFFYLFRRGLRALQRFGMGVPQKPYGMVIGTAETCSPAVRWR